MTEQNEFTKYIPTIFEDPVKNSIILFLIPAIFYIFASYGNTFMRNKGLATMITIACIFAIMEYIIRIPVILYAKKVAGLSNFHLQIIWVSLTLSLAYISDFFVIKD